MLAPALSTLFVRARARKRALGSVIRIPHSPLSGAGVPVPEFEDEIDDEDARQKPRCNGCCPRMSEPLGLGIGA